MHVTRSDTPQRGAADVFAVRANFCTLPRDPAPLVHLFRMRYILYIGCGPLRAAAASCEAYIRQCRDSGLPSGSTTPRRRLPWGTRTGRSTARRTFSTFYAASSSRLLLLPSQWSTVRSHTPPSLPLLSPLPPSLRPPCPPFPFPFPFPIAQRKARLRAATVYLRRQQHKLRGSIPEAIGKLTGH